MALQFENSKFSKFESTLCYLSHMTFPCRGSAEKHFVTSWMTGRFHSVVALKSSLPLLGMRELGAILKFAGDSADSNRTSVEHQNQL
jgi:hypothetical protein